MQAMKQSGNMGFVKRNAEFLGDDFGDSRGGPSLSAKPVGFGTVPEEIGNQPQLIERQSARSTWSWLCHQRCLAAKACRSEPMTDSAFGTSKATAISRCFQPRRLNCQA